jgi:hypothetical protein
LAVKCFNDLEIPYDYCDVKIFTDSQKAIHLIGETEKMSSIATESTMDINDLQKTWNCSLKWIRGHSRITGNDIADQMAKKAKRMRSHGPGPYAPLHMNVIRKHIHTEMKRRWDKKFEENKIAHTKSIFNKLNHSKKYRKKVLRMKRSDLHHAVSWISGHCNLKKHLKTIGRSNDNMCRMCKNDIETPNHLLRDCPYTDDIREEFESDYSQQENKDKAFSWKRQRYKITFTATKPTIGLLEYVVRISTKINAFLKTLNKK